MQTKLLSGVVLAMLVAGVAGCGTQPSSAPPPKPMTHHKKHKTHQKPATLSRALAKTNPVGYVERYDQNGIQAMLKSEAQYIPGVPLTGPNAGLFTLAALNGPLQKRYPGPTIPPTLAAAGVHLTVPANNSIIGVQAYANAVWPTAASWFPGMTEAIFEQGIETMAKAGNAVIGNDPAQELLYVLGPYEPNGQGDHAKSGHGTLAQLMTEKNTAVFEDYSANPTLANAPQHQYTYAAWTTIVPPPASAFVHGQLSLTAYFEPLYWNLPSQGTGVTANSNLPPGVTVKWGMLVNDGIRAHEVFSSIYHGKFDVIEDVWTVPQMQVAYVVNPNGQGQWFVTQVSANAVNSLESNYPIK